MIEKRMPAFGPSQHFARCVITCIGISKGRFVWKEEDTVEDINETLAPSAQELLDGKLNEVNGQFQGKGFNWENSGKLLVLSKIYRCGT